MLVWYEVCATMNVLGSFTVRYGMCVQAQGSGSLGVTSDSALEKVNRIGQVNAATLW